MRQPRVKQGFARLVEMSAYIYQRRCVVRRAAGDRAHGGRGRACERTTLRERARCMRGGRTAGGVRGRSQDACYEQLRFTPQPEHSLGRRLFPFS